MGVIIMVVLAAIFSSKDKPILGAAIFSSYQLILGFVGTASGIMVFVPAIASMVYCGIFFSILTRFNDDTASWAAIIAIGAIIWYVAPLLIVAKLA